MLSVVLTPAEAFLFLEAYAQVNPQAYEAVIATIKGFPPLLPRQDKVGALVDLLFDEACENTSFRSHGLQQNQKQKPEQKQRGPPSAAMINSIRSLALHEDVARNLWEFGFEEEAIIEALKRNSTLEGCLAFMTKLSPSVSLSNTFTCCVCLDDELSAGNLYSMDCRCSHKFCIPCTATHIEVAVTPTLDSPPHIPACPCASDTNPANRCEYLLSEEEIKQVVALAEEKGAIDRDKGNYILRQSEKLFVAKFHRELKHISCPACDDANDGVSTWFEADALGLEVATLVTCPRESCGVTFCSLCKTKPYHFHSTCEEVVGFARSWNEWNARGRQAYIEALAREDQQYQSLLASFENKKKEHKEEIDAAAKRHEDLVQDENYKASTCKLCPHCQRVVNKLSGCDLMVCGRNYHGGDIQNGCGKQFNWNSAPSYVANYGEKKTVHELDIQAPIQTQREEHFVCEGVPMTCDECKQPIVGPRIQCLNCPEYNHCLSCNVSYEGGHRAEGFGGGIGGGGGALLQRTFSNGNHSLGHICTVIYKAY